MATLLDYARIANQVYDGKTKFSVPGWTCLVMKIDKSVFEGGNLFSSGFQGGAYYNGAHDELVIGFKGTVFDGIGKKTMTSDLVADLKILVGNIPTQANVAQEHVKGWRRLKPKARVSLVGHSLGGGLAQIVGSWMKIPFVSFNAPAMGHAYLLGHINVINPTTMYHTVFSRRMNSGVNYRMLNDPVSKLGNHIGKVVKIDGGKSIKDAHGMAGFVKVIEEKGIGGVNPFAS